MSLLLDVEFNQAKGTSVVRFNPYTGSNKIQSIADMKFPYYKNFLGDDLAYETQMMNIFAQLNYKVSENWTSQTIISRARSTINGYISAINGKQIYGKCSGDGRNYFVYCYEYSAEFHRGFSYRTFQKQNGGRIGLL
jgi:hypothetical protein